MDSARKGGAKAVVMVSKLKAKVEVNEKEKINKISDPNPDNY